jgi:phosphatidylglycerol:prolipoprotein diacylglycerol transferase
MFFCMLGTILGGRLGYVLFYGLTFWAKDPWYPIKVWDGGMSFHGGLLGVIIALTIFAVRRRRRVADVFDFAAPLPGIGLFAGRIGNFINGELWGKVTHAGWGVIFPNAPELAGATPMQLQAAYAAGALNQYARHPSPLYEAALEGLVMFVVLWLYSRKPRPRYRVAALFALMYGSFRFLVEFVRVPDAQLGYLAFGWLTMGQVLELPVIAFGLYCLWRSFGAPTLQPQPLAVDAR